VFHADLIRAIAADVASIPAYYGNDFAAFRQGIRGVASAPPIQPFTVWDIHTWQMDLP